MLESIKETQSKEHNIEVVFRVDDTDTLLNEPSFKEQIYQMTDVRFFPRFIYGPETFPDLGCLWNECFNDCHGDILMVGGDDLIFKTQDWDQMLVKTFEKYPDGIVLAWGSDGTFENRLATHPIISRKWVETVGWFFPPIGLTYANDNFLYNLMYRLGRLHFIGEMKIEHKWDGGNPEDPNYGRMGTHFDRSHEVLNGAIGQNCMKEAESKLREVMK
jgi:hypothetical protein